MHKITKRNLINCLIRHLWPSLLFSHLRNAQKNCDRENEKVIIAATQYLLQVTIFTCVSERFKDFASSFRSCPTTYWFFSKACSSFKSWLGEKAVRIRLGFLKGRRNSGNCGPEREKVVCEYIEICCGKRASRITQIGRVQSVSHD